MNAACRAPVFSDPYHGGVGTGRRRTRIEGEVRPLTEYDHEATSLERLEAACLDRFTDALVRRVEGAPLPCVLVSPSPQGARRVVATSEVLIGITDGPLTDADLKGFATWARDYRRRLHDTGAVIELAWETVDSIPDELRREARRQWVRLYDFVYEFEARGDLPPRPLAGLGGPMAAQAADLAGEAAGYPSSRYVPQQYIYQESLTAATSRPDLLLDLIDWLAEDRLCFVALLSDAGMGKTFLLRELARRLPQAIPDVPALLVTLTGRKSMADLARLVQQFLKERNGNTTLTSRAFQSMLGNGQLILLLDGFDELADHNTFDAVYRDLEPVVAAATGRAKIVIAARSQHFPDSRWFESALHDDRQEFLDQGSRIVSIETFTEAQIRDFLGRVFTPAAADRVRARLRAAPWLFRLAGVPRMLSLIVQELTDGVDAVAPDPDTPDRLLYDEVSDGFDRLLQDAAGRRPTDLVERLTGLWLQAEEARFSGYRLQPAIIAETALDALGLLARRLWIFSEHDDTIRIGDLNVICAHMVTGRPLPERPGPKDVLPAAEIVKVKEMEHALASATLLVRPEPGEHHWAFMDPVIQQYLVALTISRELDAGWAGPAGGADGRIGRDLGLTPPHEGSALAARLLDARRLTDFMVQVICQLSSTAAWSWAQEADRRPGLLRKKTLVRGHSAENARLLKEALNNHGAA